MTGGRTGGTAPTRAERATVPAAALAPAAAAALAAAMWLRGPSVPYLVAEAVATAAALVAAWRAGRGFGWIAAAAVAAIAFGTPAIATQRELGRMNADRQRHAAERVDQAMARLQGDLDRAARDMRKIAVDALDAPPDVPGAFDRLRRLVEGGGAERAVMLARGSRPFAWGGTIRVHPDSLPGRPLAVSMTPFYVVLHAAADRGDRRAVAMALIHAQPPADTLAVTLDRAVRGREVVSEFEYAVPTAVPPGDPGWRLVTAKIDDRDIPLVAVRPVPLDTGAVRLRVRQAGITRAGPALAAMLVVFLGAAWWGPTRLARRLLALAVPLAGIAVAPLNAFSNATSLFDPGLYFANIGAWFTASVGALALTSAIVLLGLFAVLHAKPRFRSRLVSGLLVISIAGVAPFLLRALGRGITPPPLGATGGVWVAWQVTLFLSAAAVLVAGAAAGRATVARVRGLPPAVAPALATVAALAGPVFWLAPAGWPGWYPLVWTAAIVAVALTRRSRMVVLNAAIVAGLGAATLVWGTTARRRVELASQDVAGLVTPDSSAIGLLDRLGASLVSGTAPDTPAELLQRYARSPLAASDFPVSLASWSGPALGDSVVARVSTASLSIDSTMVRPFIDAARQSGAPQIGTVLGEYGAVAVLAAPHDEGRVTTVAVFPRARVVADDPISPLLGLPRPVAGTPPYTIQLLERGTAAAPAVSIPRWTREGSDIHGDWVIRTAGGSARAHVEVALRPLPWLVQRGALLTLLDLALLGLLWALPSLADGTLTRRVLLVSRGWSHSYRARLTLALSAFFVVPATVFAVWAYVQLRSGDRQSRELIVNETLRTAAELRVDSVAAVQRRGTPLLVYEGGALTRASDQLFLSLAPIGVFLPPQVALQLPFGDELVTNPMLDVGPIEALFGFRAASGPGDSRLVLAAPARTDDTTLDQRRRDLGYLVLLAVAGGALAALWLSGLAARELARPVGTLQRAALAVAGGEREPALTGNPPAEFRPVFDAFRRMASDLAASEAALEAARRRTADVLRHVASGVVALDGDGRVLIANPRASTLLARPIAPGDSVEAVSPPEMAASVREFLQSGSAAGAEDAFELEFEGRQLRARLTPLAGRTGGRGAAVLTVDDLTELARAQRVLAWGEMARQVAHEIKNPLTPIRLGVQHLRRAHRDGRADFAAILERNVERILAEIDRLDEIARAFSRYGTAPDQRAPAESVDVAMVARDVVALERLGHAEAAVDWQLVGADVEIHALAREEELREVLLNLLENARLAGARTVRVVVGREDVVAYIAVEDDGEGIEADVLPRVFEPHFSTRTSGSGLGLAISRRLVDGWGGAITLASQRGRGTTVRIALRAAPVADRLVSST